MPRKTTTMNRRQTASGMPTKTSLRANRKRLGRRKSSKERKVSLEAHKRYKRNRNKILKGAKDYYKKNKRTLLKKAKVRRRIDRRR